MAFQGQTLSLSVADNGIAELVFDNQNESVNKFDTATINELSQALDHLEKTSNIKGLVVRSNKPVFIVGADILEFVPQLGSPSESIIEFLKLNNTNFNRIEDLPYPTVAAVDGFALGGGFECALSCDYRIAGDNAQVGLPETKLGIIPGWGGTVRLPRLIGVDNAAEWIATGKNQKPAAALDAGAIDALVASEGIQQAAIDMALRAANGELDYMAQRNQKTSPLILNKVEAGLVFQTCKAAIGANALPHYPAPIVAVEVMELGAGKGRDEALQAESQGFAKVFATPQAMALIGVFLGDQFVSKQAKSWGKKASKPKVEKAAVLGAGIMGGGIAYVSALKGTYTLMKDINQAGIDLGLSEASKLLSKQVERGRMKSPKMAEVLNQIQGTLTYDGFEDTEVIVEAVVENPKVKHAVLAEVESKVSEDTILTSNTSTISISYLAEALKRPENFCGMHFFNPVHAMPLVEVIRGEKSSDEAIARTVAYANSMGKKAIVVGDCPGFLVNRVLFPYFLALELLILDGADFHKVDKVMERWGWPMGPAYLADVVGLDTCSHCIDVMAEGFPERMKLEGESLLTTMSNAQRFGQKNNLGFYEYEKDKKGRPKKLETDAASQLLASRCATATDFDDDEIIMRMMLPMATEMVRCLEEGIVETPAEADMALIYGLGFPPFRGGIFQWMDTVGLDKLVAKGDELSHLGELYKPTQGLRDLAEAGKKYRLHFKR